MQVKGVRAGGRIASAEARSAAWRLASTSTAHSWSYEQLVAGAIAAMILVRIICAAAIPLAFDEALYWRYSKHLAAGFLDHPFLNPLMIKIGTSVFGDTPLGVRVVSILLGLPASWAVWRTAAILFADSRIGATAALFFNLTLVMALGSMLATSDNVVVTTTCFLLLALAKVNQTGRGEWWLAVGTAFGLGMCAKYTTALFAVGIVLWLVLAPEQRKWLRSPWTWLGGFVALAIFSPVLLWNADHHWASLVYQSNRLVIRQLSLGYLGELVASQFGLATPPIFVLACLALFWGLRQPSEPYSARVLLGAMIWPVLIYFAWHALHERVQGNWPEPMYPALAIACALAAHQLRDQFGVGATTARLATLSAVPVGLVLAAAVYLQAIFGVFSVGTSDPTLRVLGAGWPALADRIDGARAAVGARVILTTDYEAASWLAFYLRSRTPVEQINQRVRWVNEPAPDPHLFDGPMIYVCKNDCGRLPQLQAKFVGVDFIGTFARTHRGLDIEHYSLYRLSHPTAPTLDPLYADLQLGVPR